MKTFFSILIMCIGIGIMCASLVTILLVFTHRTEPLRVFQIKGPQIPMPSIANPTEAFSQFFGTKSTEHTVSTNTIDLIPTDSFNEILNIGATYWLMSFFLTAGQKITSLGIDLFRIPSKMASKESV